jgi:hypothetical protein
MNGSTGCSNASIREAIIYEQIGLQGVSLNFRELALRRTDLVLALHSGTLQPCQRTEDYNRLTDGYKRSGQALLRNLECSAIPVEQAAKSSDIDLCGSVLGCVRRAQFEMGTRDCREGICDRMGKLFDLKSEETTASGGVRYSVNGSQNRRLRARCIGPWFGTEGVKLDSQTTRLLCYPKAMSGAGKQLEKLDPSAPGSKPIVPESRGISDGSQFVRRAV